MNINYYFKKDFDLITGEEATVKSRAYLEYLVCKTGLSNAHFSNAPTKFFSQINLSTNTEKKFQEV